MRSVRALALLGLLLCSSSPLWGDEPVRIELRAPEVMPAPAPSMAPAPGSNCGPCRCPDDYCRKPIPCVKCPLRGCVDDYCCKPQPCVKCPPRGCVDDYCAKPWCLPHYCRVPGYTCGPPDRCRK